jgi:hypothetical protein
MFPVTHQHQLRCNTLLDNSQDDLLLSSIRLSANRSHKRDYYFTRSLYSCQGVFPVNLEAIFRFFFARPLEQPVIFLLSVCPFRGETFSVFDSGLDYTRYLIPVKGFGLPISRFFQTRSRRFSLARIQIFFCYRFALFQGETCSVFDSGLDYTRYRLPVKGFFCPISGFFQIPIRSALPDFLLLSDPRGWMSDNEAQL